MECQFYIPRQKFSLWERLCCQFDDRKSLLKRYNDVFHYPNRLEKSFPCNNRFLNNKIFIVQKTKTCESSLKSRKVIVVGEKWLLETYFLLFVLWASKLFWWEANLSEKTCIPTSVAAFCSRFRKFQRDWSTFWLFEVFKMMRSINENGP